MSKLESLRREYEQLTPHERSAMIIEAAGRGDSSLVETLLRSGPTGQGEAPRSLIIGWAQDCAVSQERALNCHKAWLQKVGVSNNISPAIQELLDRLQAESDTEPPTQH